MPTYRYFQESGKINSFNKMLAQREGVCRHRSLLFMAADLVGIEVRIVRNDVHMFVEVKLNHEWYQLCLGGSEDTELNLIPLPEEKPTQLVFKIECSHFNPLSHVTVGEG